MKNIEQYRNRFNSLLESTIGDVRPLISEQEDDMMINKPGSGKNITSSVNVTVKNLTKNSEEEVTSKFYDNDDYSEILSKIEQGGQSQSFYKDMFGYAVETILKKDNYDDFDSLMVEFIIPLSVEDLEVSNYSKNLVSKLDYTSVGTNKTKVSLFCKIDNFESIVLSGDTDQESPIPDVGFVKFDFVLRFK